MKIIRASFFNTYPNPSTGQWIKIGLEAELTEFDDYRKCLYELKKNINDFYYESTKSEEKKVAEINSIQNTNGKHEVKIGITPEDIYSCQTVKVLEQSYKYLVKNKPVLQEAYDKKYLELTKSQ